MPDALASLDAFLTPGAAGRQLTRRVRRHLHGFQSLAVIGPPEATRGVILRLLETLPIADVHALAFDHQGPRMGRGSGANLAWSPVDVQARDALRAFLRQDPDVVAATHLTASELEIAFQASCTGHLTLFGCPAQTLAELEALWRRPQLEAFVPLWPAVLVLDSSGYLTELVRHEGSQWVPLPDVALVARAPERREASPRLHPVAHTPQARNSWVPRTQPGALSPHRIGARSALLPPPAGWPSCPECGSPKRHVVQLSGADLPLPFRRSDDVVQLFLCPSGCDLTSDSGPTLLSHPPAGLVETSHPKSSTEGFGGGIIEWVPRQEDPHPNDAEPAREGDPEALSGPWNCDKLGGWPRWEQGPEWPDHGGARMELLFQVAEAGASTPGTPAEWDDEKSEEVPGTPSVSRLDPEAPVHLPGLFSGGDGCGWLFRSTVDPRVLRFLWQTS